MEPNPSTLIRLLRLAGLAPFGYQQENFHSHHQLLLVWGPLLPSRWEVYRWPVGTGSYELSKALRPLRLGSYEAYQRIGSCTERVYAGRDWNAAKRAASGLYPDGTSDTSRPPVPWVQA